MYCRFRKEYDHDNECRDLKNQIEDLIRKGHVGHHVRDWIPTPERQHNRNHLPHPKEPIEKQIDVIMDGPAAEGDSSLARKVYARAMVKKRSRRHHDPKITFQPKGEDYPDHNDALVIMVHITNAQVKRIFIDIGSLTDVLYFDVFQKLGLTDKDLVLLTSTLTGFTGDSVSPLDTMTLPVMVGEGQH
ncbi:hypothetical protein B296_00051787 [Ensete ventricosum]|uniref:Reverse transcriptase domain-containing protein n=1 Tax=Ensete ventricosum TaxID=4639 RepID=A0A426YF39_ENSVE|nr:hypothetical protein B296_00051787 [Ensete ventricosum]